MLSIMLIIPLWVLSSMPTGPHHLSTSSATKCAHSLLVKVFGESLCL